MKRDDYYNHSLITWISVGALSTNYFYGALLDKPTSILILVLSASITLYSVLRVSNYLKSGSKAINIFYISLILLTTVSSLIVTLTTYSDPWIEYQIFYIAPISSLLISLPIYCIVKYAKMK